MKKKVLVVVAHPDDETIWMGGTILKNREEWDLTIVCLCRGGDVDRSPKFKKVCEMFGAKCFISDLDDAEDGDYKKISEREIIERIKKFADKDYDIVFTHGVNGEYGHVRHIEVHNSVEKMIKDGIICCERVFFFAYVLRGGCCVADARADKFISYDNFIGEEKRSVVHKVYGFERQSFEFRSANKRESFKIKGKNKSL